MQQRQLRLGDVLDDYCPRERRLTNHAVVAMVGSDVKLTRCTACESEHEYKQGKAPRLRKKGEETGALYSQVLANGPKRGGAGEVVETEPLAPVTRVSAASPSSAPEDASPASAAAGDGPDEAGETSESDGAGARETALDEAGPVHRALIRATLPRHEGQVTPGRQAPEFTIRQPAGRPASRFRGRPMGASGQTRSSGEGFSRNGGGPRPQGGRPPQGPGPFRSHGHHDAGRKRSK